MIAAALYLLEQYSIFQIRIRVFNTSCQDVLLQKGSYLNNKLKSGFDLLVTVEMLCGGKFSKTRKESLRKKRQAIWFGLDADSISSLSSTDCRQPINLPFFKIDRSITRMIFPHLNEERGNFPRDKGLSGSLCLHPKIIRIEKD